MSPILHTLAHRLEQLPVQERKLAESILQSPEDVLHLGIRELSERCGVSAATVTRFCKSLHFKGYPDFKMKLAAELSHSNRNGEESYQDIVAGNSLFRIVQAIQANHTASIADTTRLLDFDKLEQAIAWLSATSRIDLYGMATSSIVAQDFYQKLIRIGKNSTAFADSHMQITSASSLGAEDVAFAVSYSGETQETIAALRCAKEQGAKTLSLTSFGNNTLAGLADIALFSSSLEEGMRRGDMASRIAQLHIIDILFTGMVSADFDKYIPRLEGSYQQVSKLKKQPGGH